MRNNYMCFHFIILALVLASCQTNTDSNKDDLDNADLSYNIVDTHQNESYSDSSLIINQVKVKSIMDKMQITQEIKHHIRTILTVQLLIM